MFDPSVWGWPQFVLMAVVVIKIAINAALDGQELDGKWSAADASLHNSFLLVVLSFGGFFA